ncbi:MAG: prephenate dehydratase [Vicinamibacteria bacterium]
MSVEQTGLVVTIAGQPGSFAHAAAAEHFGPAAAILPARDAEAALEAVRSGRAARAVLPFESTRTGSLHENFDRLRASGLHIVGEVRTRDSHCLAARPGASLAGIRRASARPEVLARCRGFFERNPAIEATTSYGGGLGELEHLIREGPVSFAMVAPAFAARVAGATLLVEELDDDADWTRSLALAREPGDPARAGKTSLLFSLRNAPGALHAALAVFAARGVDLSKIESRPLRGRPWEYAFYLDALGDPRGAVAEAIEALRALSRDLEVLGSYPDGLRGEEPLARVS